MKRFFLSILALSLVACAGDFEPDSALAQIGSQSEFSTPIYAPLHLGREILTGENHAEPDKYIKTKYASLLDAGLISYNVKEKNSWRTLVELSLTDKAASMLDKSRTDDFQSQSGERDIFYVAVCNLRPSTIVGIDTLAADTVRLKYSIVEQDITPFGSFLGFESGKVHNHSRNFVRSTFNWDLIPL